MRCSSIQTSPKKAVQYRAAVFTFKKRRERQVLASQNNSVSVERIAVREHPLLPKQRLLCFAHTKSDFPTLQITESSRLTYEA